jgi:hypothetical protein
MLDGPVARVERGRGLVVVGHGDHVEVGAVLDIVDQVARRHQTVRCAGVQVQVGAAEGVSAGRRQHGLSIGSGIGRLRCQP